MALFSIITITYNSEKTIERTLKSVLAQSCKDYEYIIIDGASEDSTMDIVREYEPLFQGRMKWKSEQDKGIYDAMNKGIKLSTGIIVGIVNSDDWLESNALSLVQQKFEDVGNREDCIYCGGIIYHKEGIMQEWMVNLSTFYRQASLFVMAGIRHPATFVPRNIYNNIGLFDDNMKLAADQDFILRCYFSGVEFIPIYKSLSNMSAGGISTRNDIRARKLSCDDRKIMLKNFGKTGIKYFWLYYSWKIRSLIRHIAIGVGLYK